MKNVKKIWFLAIWLLLLSGNQGLSAGVEMIELDLKQYREIKVCGEESDKRFQISVGVGEVQDSDKFYSYTMDIYFNPEKIKFMSMLKINTLSEFFEYTGQNIWEEGWLRVYGATFSNYSASGDKPLIAFEVKYIDDCPDTAHISIDLYEIEIEPEFLERFESRKKTMAVSSAVKEHENSFVEAGFTMNMLNDFGEDSTAEVMVRLNTNNLQNVSKLDFDLSFEKNDIFELLDIVQLSDKMVVDTVYNIITTDDRRSYVLKTSALSSINDESILMLKLKRKLMIDDTIVMDINITGINDCTCATDLRGEVVSLVSSEDTTTKTNNYEIEDYDINISAYYDYRNTEYIFRSNREIKDIAIYNVNGARVGIWEYQTGSYEERIDFNYLPSGVYISRVSLIDGFEKNIVLIKN